MSGLDAVNMALWNAADREVCRPHDISAPLVIPAKGLVEKGMLTHNVWQQAGRVVIASDRRERGNLMLSITLHKLRSPRR